MLGRPPRPCWTLVAWMLALGGCVSQTQTGGLDAGGSTLEVAPANVVAGQAQAAAATLRLRGSDGAALALPGAGVRLAVAGCAVGSAWAQVDAAGEAVLPIGLCAPGQHAVQVDLQVDGEVTRLAVASALLAFRAASVDATGAPAGTALNLALVVPGEYVGPVAFLSSDPAAILPDGPVLTPSDHGVRMLPAALRLATPGQQTVDVVNPATGVVLSRLHFQVVAPQTPAGFGDRVAVALALVLPETAVAGAPWTAFTTAVNARGEAVPATVDPVTLTGPEGLQAGVTAPPHGGTAAFGGLSLTRAGPAEVAVRSARGLVGRGQLTVVAAAPAALRLAPPLALGAPVQAVAGTPIQAMLTAVDGFGNPVPAFSDRVDLVPSDPFAEFGTGLPVDLWPGRAAVVDVTFHAVGSQGVVARGRGSHLVGRLDGVAVVAGPVAGLRLAAAAGAVVAVPMAEVGLTTTDVFGNPATGYGGQVAWGSDDPQATLPAVPAAGALLGGALTVQPGPTFAATGAAHLRVDGVPGGVLRPGEATVAVAGGPPDLAHLTLAAPAGTTVADGQASATLLLRAADAQNLPSGGWTVSIQCAAADSTCTADAAATDARGELLVRVRRTVAATLVVTAEVDGQTVSQSVPFVPGPVAPARVVFAASPADPVANGVDPLTLTVGLADAQGNAIVGRPLQLASNVGGDVVSALQPANGRTDAQGRLTAHLGATAAGPRILTLTVAEGAFSLPVTFVAGPAAAGSSFLAMTPRTQRADGQARSAVVVVALDARGNPLAGAPVTLTASGTGNLWGTASGLTDAQGFYSTTLASTQPEAKTIAAALPDGVTLSQAVTFVAAPAVVAGSSLTAVPAVLVADGVAAATVTLAAVDGLGHPAAGQAVALSADGDMQLGAVSGVTDARGMFVTTVKGHLAGAQTVRATVGPDGAVLAAQVQVDAGPPATATSRLDVAPGSPVADGVAPQGLTASFFDAYGNPVAGVPVTIAASGSDNVLTPAAGVTDAAGTLAVLLRSTRAEAKVVTATAGAAAVSATASFVAGPVAASTSTFVANPPSAVADGADSLALEVTARDVFHNAVGGATVTITGLAAGDSAAASTGSTDAAGRWTTALRSVDAGARMLSAAVDSATLTAQVAFASGAAAPGPSSLSATPSSVIADGQATVAVSVVVRDGGGGPVSNQAIALSLSGSGNVVAPATGLSAADGSWSATVSSTHAEAKVLTAQFGPVTLTLPLSFVPGPVSLTGSTFTVSAPTVVADGTSTVQVAAQLVDALGNPVAGEAVTLSASGSGNALSFTAGQTAADGTAGGTFATTVAGDKTLTLAFAAGSLQATVRGVAGPPAAATSHLTVSPAAPLADGVAQATVEVDLADAQGNPVGGEAVALSVGGQGNVLSGTVPANGQTDAAGTLSATLRSTVAQSKAVTAVAGGLTLNGSVTFVAGPADPGGSALLAAPASLAADGLSTSTLTLRAVDAAGNAAAGRAVAWTASGTGAVLSAGSGVTDAGGMLATTLRSSVAQALTVTATLDGVAITAGVTFVSGAADSGQSALTVTPATVVADGSHTVALVATARDAQGNPIVGQPVTLAASGGGTLSPTSGVTDGRGRLLAGFHTTVAGAVTLTATFGAAQATAAVTAVAGPASAAQSTLGVAPATVPADGSSQAVLTVQVLDAQQNPVAGEQVTWLASGSGNVFGTPSGVTGSDGRASVTLASAVAEVKAITARLAAGDVTATATFAAGSALAANSALDASPVVVVADGSATTALTVRLRDAQGNGVAGAAVTLASSGSGNTLSVTTGTTAADGTLALTLASVTAEAKTVTATFAGGQVTAGVSFVAGPVAAGTSSVATSPGSAVADGTAALAVTVQARDAQGNAVPGAAVMLAASGLGNALTSTSGVTDAGGGFATTWRATQAGVKTLTATVAGITLTTTATFTAGGADAGTSSLTASPASQTADGSAAVALTVTVRDAQGNPVAGQPVVFASSGGSDALSPTSGTTAADGTLTTSVRATVAEAKTLTASFASIQLTAGATFTAGPPTVAASTLTVSPGALTADGVSTATLTLALADAHNNPVAGQAVAFSASGTGNTWAPASGTTGSDGRLVSTFATTVAEAKVLTASFAGLQRTVALSAVAGPPTVGSSTLALSPTTAVANQGSVVAITATVRDAAGNPVAGETVTFAAGGSGNTFTFVTRTTGADGVAATGLTSGRAETKMVTATFSAGTLNANATFVPGPVSASTSAVVATPATVVADDVATSAVVVTARDAQGNLVPGQAVTLALSGSGGTLSPSAGTTDAAGQLAVQAHARVAEAKTVTATLGSVTVTCGLTFTAGASAAGHSSLTATPSSVVADGVATSGLALTIRDAQDNPVPGQAVNLTVSGSGNTLTPSSGSTAADGTLGATLASTVAEVKTITASFAGATLVTYVTLVPGVPSAGTSDLAASPAGPVADGAATTTLTAHVRDAQGNPIAGQTVTFAAGGSGNVLSAPTAVTAADGRAQVTLRSTVAGSKALTTSFAGTGNSAGVTFVPGPVAAGTSSLLAAPGSAVADGVTAVTLTARARDAQGNAVPGQAVTVAADGSGNALGASSGSTDAGGNFVTTLKSTVAETKNLTATVAGVALQTSATFTVGPPVAASSSLVASPATATADGSAAVALTVTVRDGQGNPIAGQAVSFASSNAGDTVSPSGGTTAADGTLAATVRATVAEAKTLTATFGGSQLTTNATFVAGPPTAANSTVTAASPTLVASGSASDTVTVRLADAYNNPVAGQAVTLSASGSGNTLTPTSGTTAADGRLVTSFRTTVAEAKTLTAAFAATQVTAAVTAVPGPAAPASSTLGLSPATAVADGSAAIAVTATLRDAQGNAVAGQAVTFGAGGSGNTFSPASGVTAADGTVATQLASTVAEGKQITATFSTGTINASATFVAGPLAAGTSSLVASPTSLVADNISTSALVVTARDAAGNPIGGQAVSVTLSGSGTTVSPGSGTTNAAGQFTAYAKASVAEAKVATATLGGVTLTANLTFTAGTTSVGNSTIAAAPGTVVADGSAQSTITVVIRDGQNNPVVGQAVALSVNGSHNALSPSSGSTAADGSLTATLSSTTAEAKTVTASFSSSTMFTTVTFVAGSPAAGHSQVLATPATQTADGSATAALTATLRDAQDNPVGGQTVTFAVGGTSNTLSGTTATTAADGTAQVTLTSTHAETKSLTASFAATQVTGNVTFVPGPVASGTSSVAAAPGSAVADGSAAVTVTVLARDAQNNPVPGQAVALSADGTANVWAAATGTTDAAGSYSTTLTSTVAQAKTVTATVGGATVTTTATFTPGPAAAAHSSFTSTPSSLVANGTSQAALALVVRDAHDNPVPGVAVTLSASGGANTLSPSSGTTAADGSLGATLASTLAESKTVTAAFAGTQLTAPVTFVAGSASTSTSTVTASPSTLTANGSATSTVTVRLLDVNNNPVAGLALLLSASGSGNTLSPTSGTSAADGRLVATFSTTVAEAKTFTATFGASAITGTLTAAPGPVAPGSSSFTATPASATANGSATLALAVILRDAQGNVVPGQGVTFSASGTGQTISPGSATTAADGTASATIASTRAEAKTVTVAFTGGTLTAPATFVPGPVTAAQSTLTATPSSVTADGSTAAALLVTARDAQGNPVPGQAVTLSLSGSGGSVSPASGTTDASGQFTAQARATLAEAKTATATVGGATLTAGVTFVPGAASGPNSTVAASPGTLVADGVTQTAISVVVRDAQNNPVPGVSVSLTASGSQNTGLPQTSTTATDGSVTAALASTLAEAKTITATFAGISITTTATFVAGAPVVGNSALTASPTSPTADGTATTTLSARLYDAQNNPVGGQTVTFAAGGTGNTLSGTTATTSSAGVAQVTLASTRAEPKALTATFGGSQLNATVTFVPGAGASATSSVSASPTSLTANGTATTTLTVLVRDAQSNPIPGQAVSVSSSGSGNTIASASGTTDASGTYATTLTSTVAQAKTVTAMVAGLTLTTPVTFVAGPALAANTSLSASPATLTANGSSQSTLLLTVRDAQNNPVPGQAVTLSASGSGNTLSATSGTTAADGTLGATLSSTVAEAKTITATFASQTVTANVTFVAGPPAVGPSALVASPGTVVADGSTQSTLTLTVRDAQGNPVAGQSVTIASTGSANSLSATSGTTAANGTLAVTLSSTKAESKTVTASFAGLQASTTVQLVAGPPVAGNSTFAASPTTLVADGTTTTTVTTLLRDAQNNAVPGQAVTFASTGSGNVWSATAGSTAADGTFSATLKSAVAGSRTLTLTAGGVTLNASATFTAGPASSSTSSVTASPTSVTANGSSAATLSVLIRDAQNNPVGSQALTFAASGSGNTLSATAGTTAADGTASLTLTSTYAEAKTVTVTFASTSVTTTVTFVPGPVSASTSTVAASPMSLVADNTATTTVTVQARDAQGNAVPSQAVTLASNGSGNTFSATSGSTDASGVFTATLKSTVAQAKTLTATMGSVNVTGTVTFVAGAPVAGTSSLTLTPASVTANGSATAAYTVLLKDAQGNVVSGQSVTLSSTGSANTFTPASGTTAADGTLSGTLSSTKAESKTVTAAFASTQVTSGVSFVAGPATAAQSQVTVSPTSLTADGSTATTATVLLKDAQGNVVGGQSVTLTSSGTANTWTGATGTTAAGGTFSATLTSTKAEAKTITATFNSLTVTTTVTFVPGSPSAGTSQVTASPASLTADGTATTTLTTIIRDAQSNPVSGTTVTLSSTGSANSFSATSGSTNASGTVTVTLASTKAEAKTVTAAFASTQVTTGVTFVAGAVATGTSTVAASPTSLTADNTTTTTATVTLRDAQSNVVPSAPVSIASSGTGNTFSATSGTANASGVWTTTLKSTKAEAKTLTATSGAATPTGTVTFVAGAATTGASSLVASPTTLASDGNTTTALTATIRDTYSNPLSGASVTLTATNSNNVFAPASGTTNASGVFTSTLASTYAGTHTVTATSGSAAPSTAVTFTVPVCNNTLSLGAVPMLATGTSPCGAAIGDLNNDGYNDAVVANLDSDTVYVYAGHNDGVFSAPTVYNVTSGGCPHVVTVADMNGDGKKDLVVGMYCNNTTGVLLGTGSGLGTPAYYASTGAHQAIAIGTLNADAYPDVAIAAVDSKIYLMMGSSTGALGTQTSVTVNASAYAYDVVMADVNNDGKQDLVVGDGNTTAKVYVLKGLGTGSFNAPAVTSLTPKTGLRSVAVADLNADGKLDVVAGMIGTTPSFAVLLGTGTGTFGTAKYTTVNLYPGYVAVGDFSGDAIPDLAVVDYGEQSLYTYGGVGNGNFLAPAKIFMAGARQSSPRALVVGSFNGDARADVLYTSRANNRATVLLGGGAMLSAPIASYGSTNVPYMISARDFNADGKMDAMLASQGNGVAYLQGDGLGNFAAPVAVVSGGPNETLTTDDVNGDGKWDVVTAGANGSNVLVNLGNGNGTFAGTVSYTTAGQPVAVAVVDVNNDGKKDIVAPASAGTAAVEVLLGNGDGTFQTAVASAADPNLVALAVGDFNGDGKVDVAAVSGQASSANLDILLGQGTATLGTASTTALSLDPRAIVAADVDNDGKLDLLLNSNGASTVSLLRGTGAGTFQAAVVLDSTCGDPHGLAVGDLNGDGKLDVIAYCGSDSSVRMLRGNGNATFAASTLYPSGCYNAWFGALADVNGDGRPDVLVADINNNSVYALLNTSCFP